MPFEAGLKQERMCWLGWEASSRGEMISPWIPEDKIQTFGDFLGGPVTRLCAPDAGGPRFDSWLGN